MGLPWVRLDTQWPHNPKFLTLVEDKKWRAISVYMAGLGYSGAHGLKGFLPMSSLPVMHGTKREAEDLIDIALWIPVPGGWEINGWAEFQPETDDAEARKSKAKKAAQKRWADQRAKEANVIEMRDRNA